MSFSSDDLDAWIQPFVLSTTTVRLLISRLCATYQDLALNSQEQFLATPVTRLPTGREEGEFLSIDLGGSNLRVAFVKLLGDSRARARPEGRKGLDAHDERIEKYNERSWPIGEALKDERAEDLFAWIGDCLAEVIRARFTDDNEDALEMPEEIPLGITFSFPMIQSSLSEAKLLPMGKGFSITSNPDLGNLLLAGYKRHTQPSSITTTSTPTASENRRSSDPLPNIRLVAISNDSVATLVSLIYTTAAATGAKPKSKTVAGLILGTGCNAAVAMRPQALHPAKIQSLIASDNVKADGRPSENIDRIVVNTEWTLRGVGPALEQLELFTRWDRALDVALATPGFQPFEYLTAGSYLGEIVRLVVYDYFVEKLQLAPETLPPRLRTRNALTTSWLGWNVAKDSDAESIMSKIRSDKDFAASEADFWTAKYMTVLMRVERLVVNRSKMLIAAAVMALLACIGELKVNPLEDLKSSRSGNGEQKIEESWQERKLIKRDKNSPSSLSSPLPTTSTPKQELAVAYCGGLINIYTGYLADLQEDLDFMVEDFVLNKEDGSSKDEEDDQIRIVLREAAEGGVIGAGVLAGTVWAG